VNTVLTINSVPTVGTLAFNLCGTKEPPVGCPTGTNSVGFFLTATDCYPLSINTGDKPTQWSYLPYNTNDPNNDGIRYHGANTDPSTPFNVEFTVVCNANVEVSNLTFVVSQLATGVIIQTEASTGCGFQLFGAFGNLQNLKWVFIAFLVIVGAAFCLFGLRVFKYTLATVGFIIG
jgi:hypothetical protein